MQFVIGRKGLGYIADWSAPKARGDFSFCDNYVDAKTFKYLSEAAEYLTHWDHIVSKYPHSNEFTIIYINAGPNGDFKHP